MYVWCSLLKNLQVNIQNFKPRKLLLFPIDLLLYDSRHHICRYSVPSFAYLQNYFFRAGLRASPVFVHRFSPLCVSLCPVSGILCVKVFPYVFFIKGLFCGVNRCCRVSCSVPISVILHPLRVYVFSVLDVKIPVVMFWRECSKVARSAVVNCRSHLSHSPLLMLLRQ